MNQKLLILAIGAFIIGTDSYIVAGLLLGITTDMSISISAAGQLVTIFAITMAIASPLLTMLTASMNPKKILVWTMIIFTMGNFVSFLSTDYFMLSSSRVIAALGAALYFPIATTLAASMADSDKQGKAISFVSAGLTIAITLGAPMGAWLGNLFNWRISFLIIALVGAIVTIIIHVVFPAEHSHERERASLVESLTPVKRVAVLLLFVAILLITTGSFAVYTYLDPIMSVIDHFSTAGVSFMFALFGGSSIIGVWLGGYLTDKIGSLPTIYLTLTFKIISLVGFSLLMHNDWPMSKMWLGCLIVSWGITAWMLNPAILKYLVSLSPKSPSVLLALNSTFSFFGTASGAAVGGVIIENNAIQHLGYLCGILQLLSLLMIVICSIGISNRSNNQGIEAI